MYKHINRLIKIYWLSLMVTGWWTQVRVTLTAWQKRARDRNAGAGDLHETYQQKLGELSIAELLVPLCAKVQPYELAVPVEGDVLVDGGLVEDLLRILYNGDKKQTSCFNYDWMMTSCSWQPNNKMQQLNMEVYRQCFAVVEEVFYFVKYLR